MAAVLDRIRQCERQFGRPDGSVELVAVSKRQPFEAIEAARQAGQQHFAENYLQEALTKISQMSEPVTWHFIGHIQSNKTREIATHFDWVHSVDREKVAERLSAQRPADAPPLNICLQVNLQNEDGKSGLRPDEVIAVAGRVSQLPGLSMRGLMAIPKPSVDFEEQRAVFLQLADLLATIQANGVDADVLSMGMTGDLEAAVAGGATHVRIGTAVFGERDA